MAANHRLTLFRACAQQSVTRHNKTNKSNAKNQKKREPFVYLCNQNFSKCQIFPMHGSFSDIWYPRREGQKIFVETLVVFYLKKRDQKTKKKKLTFPLPWTLAACAS